MITTLKQSFDKFKQSYVNLDSSNTSRARKSRDFLISNIKNLPYSIENFPKIYEDKIIKFGSFARSTKIKPLDDIDLIIAFSGNGSTYNEYMNKIDIYVPEEAKILRSLCDNINVLNSIKVVNKLRDSFRNLSHYQKAEIHRRQEAVTLKLTSYKWNFDIVPAFFTSKDSFGRNYYLIPDGNGNWKKTDPRIDQNRITKINNEHDGKILELIRIIKKWNKKQSMPLISSYLLEIILLDYFEAQNTIFKPRKELKYIFNNIKSSIYVSHYDPKGIQGDLNNLSIDEKIKISSEANSAMDYAEKSIDYENNNNHKKAINSMRKIFGSDFPKYGEEE